jgi:hypothetical protein
MIQAIDVVFGEDSQDLHTFSDVLLAEVLASGLPALLVCKEP